MRKVLSIILIIILAANLIFFALGRISTLLFWLIIGGIYLLAKFMPELE